MKKNIICSLCRGKGYLLSRGLNELVIYDCPICEGNGMVVMNIKDKRKKSKRKKLLFEQKFYW